MTPWFAALSFKRCPHVQWTMPSIQYEKHSLHCVLGSVSNNPSSSTLPMSWITFLDVVLNGLQASFCCGSCWRDCRWGWFSIFLTSSRTRQLSTCFTTECGNPRILKSMSSSFTIDCSWFCVHESRQTTGLSVLSWFVSSSTLKFVRSAQGKLVSRSIMIWDWVWLAWLWTFGLLHNFSIWFSSNFWTQLFHPIMFQRNLWRVTRCVAEDDCVRSCLIELQSFPLSKLYVDAIHSIVMSLPCFPHVLCNTRCFRLDRVKILVFFVHRIHKQKEYSLSVAQHLWSWCQSWIHDEVWIDCFSYMINVLEDTVRYNDIVLWWTINKIASRMTLVSSEVQRWSWRISEVLFTPPPASKHLSIVSRFPLWTLVHIQVSQYLIIGVWVSVRFNGYLCCFQRQRNPNHTSNFLCKKFSDGRSDINSFWYMTSSDSITSTVEIQ